MSKRPFLLITNDDGIHAPGIIHLWEAIHAFADVAIVAPNRERSGSALSITWNKPLIIQEVPWEKSTPAWTVSGTPADCVKMALSVILKQKPDMIISGINRGSNAGGTALYSGTVGAVIEGVLKKIPGIAFSFSDFEIPPHSITQKYIFPLIDHFLKNPLPPWTLLNVNFPFHCKNGIKGLKFTKQGFGSWLESPEGRLHPEGTPYYWLGGKWTSSNEDHETDVHWIENGYVAAVPLQVGELTHTTALEQHKSQIERRFSVKDLQPLPEQIQ